MRRIPQAFAARMFEVHGKRGAEWVRRLPELLSACGTIEDHGHG